MFYRLLPLAALAGPLSANCQTPPTGDALRKLTALSGAVTFSVPVAWHVLYESDTGSLAQFVYHVRNPAMDSVGDDRTNIIISVRRRLGSRAFAAYSDSLLGGLIDSRMIVLDDTTAGPAQRAVMWRGQIKSTPYAGFDDIAHSAEVWVHVRIVLPLSERTPPEWTERLSRQTQQLLQTMRFGSQAAFPVDVGYPALTAFGPSR
jgi:hypothetical protein